MPKEPKGQKRPADVIGAAVHIAKIATGEVEEDLGEIEDGKDTAPVALGRKGGAARASKLSKKQRSEIARRRPLRSARPSHLGTPEKAKASPKTAL